MSQRWIHTIYDALTARVPPRARNLFSNVPAMMKQEILCLYSFYTLCYDLLRLIPAAVSARATQPVCPMESFLFLLPETPNGSLSQKNKSKEGCLDSWFKILDSMKLWTFQNSAALVIMIMRAYEGLQCIPDWSVLQQMSFIFSGVWSCGIQDSSPFPLVPLRNNAEKRLGYVCLLCTVAASRILGTTLP